MSAPYSVPDLLDQAPLTLYQWRVFALCFAVALFDGFDTQAIAFTGPAIIQAFNLGVGALAPILTAGIVGMVLGAMMLGLIGDRFGRRPALLGAVLLFGLATVGTAFAHTPQQILVLRFLAGLGMGGATPVLLSLSAEYGPARKRGTIMTSVLLGLPGGAILGGLLAARLLPVIGWEGVFLVGGTAPLALLVLLAMALPESLHFLARRGTVESNTRIAAILSRIVRRRFEVGAAFRVTELEVKSGVSSLFSDGLARNTLAIWIIYLFNWVAWFMFLSWLPTVLKTAGLPAAQAPMGTVVVNLVFVLCAIPLSLMLPRVNTKKLLSAMFGFGILLALGLSQSGTNWTLVFLLTGAAGLGIGGQQIVLNYLVAQSYPTALRATATGWAIGLGRAGAIVGSASGGWFLEHGGPSGFYMALVIPLAIAAAGLWIIKASAAPAPVGMLATH